MTFSVGIGGSNHDFSTCLINDAGEVFAIEDERLSRVRYALFDPNPCEGSFRYVLDWCGVAREDIDRISANDYLLDPYSKAVLTEGRGRAAVPRGKTNRDQFPPIGPLNHHFTHACSTFFTSPYEEAAILVADGTGSVTNRGAPIAERETMTFGMGRANDVVTIDSVHGLSTGSGFTAEYPPLFDNSLGHLYRAVTQAVGFGWMHAGKTMGLAPYGDDRYVDKVMRHIRLLPRGQYELRMGTSDGLLATLIELRSEGQSGDPFAVDAALAKAGQVALEIVIFHALDHLWEQTKTPNLCLAGGIALNGLLNGQIPRRSKFKNVHAVFAPGDGGTALGAAMWDYVQRRESSPRTIRFDYGPFLGRPYSGAVIQRAIQAASLTYTRPVRLHQTAAEMIAVGKTLAWYEGGAEFGPRALGHRSILADPRNPEMINHINRNIKGREWFRPIAPSVIESASTAYFEAECDSPYMQFVWPVRDEYRSALPAITHVDGGSRIQSVRKRGNESLYALLEAFEEISGFPILINTSLNTHGAPIVETPEQAIDAFASSPLDVLVLGGYVIVK